jgi:hypothetical protein
MSDPTDSESAGDRQAARHEMTALPGNMLAEELGKVYVRDEGADRHVEFTVWNRQLSGSMAEGWRTGLAVDASSSMKDWLGKTLYQTENGIPSQVWQEWLGKSWVWQGTEDGQKRHFMKSAAVHDAVDKGFYRYSENIVEPLVRDFIAYLATELDAEGKCSVAYWACGDGDAFEGLGEISAEESKNLEITGPSSVGFGKNTQLLPVLSHFCTTYESARNAMLVFITDGRLDDLEEVKRFTTDLAKRIESEDRNPVKCVLIGVGDEIDIDQIEELDDLETGTEIDVWDHKIAKEMRELSEIMVELVEDVTVSTQAATVYDDQGNVVKKFSDGLPSSVSFTMPSTSKYFELEVGEHKVRQKVETS